MKKRKQVAQAIGIKPVSTASHWSLRHQLLPPGFALTSLSSGLLTRKYKRKYALSSPGCFWLWVFYNSNRNPKTDIYSRISVKGKVTD